MLAGNDIICFANDWDGDPLSTSRPVRAYGTGGLAIPLRPVLILVAVVVAVSSATEPPQAFTWCCGGTT
jgi:hypothetical protein